MNSEVTRIDDLAAQIVVAIVNSPSDQQAEVVEIAKEQGIGTAEGIAKAAYEIADALEAERIARSK